jgi:hypothetical protein
MKIRNGFVSNSSSSSFVCCITGRTESGRDMCMVDARMVESNWGLYDENELLSPNPFDGSDIPQWFIDKRKKEGDIPDEAIVYSWENMERGEIPDELCPLYNLVYIQDCDLLAYFLKQNGITRAELSSKLKCDFANLEELRKSLK